MINIDDLKRFPTVESSTWYNRKHILGFCNVPVDYNTNIKKHKVFEYVYFCIRFNNDHDTLIIDDEGHKYTSEKDFHSYIESRFPGYLNQGKCYQTVAPQQIQLGVR